MAYFINSTAGSAQSGIIYKLRQNKMVSTVKGKTAYCAVVEAPAVSLDRLAERMVDEGLVRNTRVVTETFDAIAEAAAKFLKEGYAVNLGSLVRLRPSIKGTTDTEDAELSDADNPVIVVASAGTMLRDVARDAVKIRVTDGTSTVVEITKVKDQATLLTTAISSGGTYIVNGTNLTWDHTAADEGFFLALNGEETKSTLLDEDTSMGIFLKNEATWTADGQAISLIFRARGADGTLQQYLYAGALTTYLDA